MFLALSDLERIITIILILYSTLQILVIYLLIRSSRKHRQTIFRFFGLSDKNHSFEIVISRLQIKEEGGTVAVGESQVTKGYIGPTINYVEYQMALEVIDLFQPISINRIPNSLQRIAKSFTSMATLKPTIEISPYKHLSEDNLGKNLFLIGDGIYNLYSQHFLKHHPKLVYEFRKNKRGVRAIFEKSGEKREIIGRDVQAGETPSQLALIHRAKIPSKNNRYPKNTVFICAGTGTAATCKSVKFLLDNRVKITNKIKLLKKVKNPQEYEFSILLRFKDMPADVDHKQELDMFESVEVHEFRIDAHKYEW